MEKNPKIEISETNRRKEQIIINLKHNIIYILKIKYYFYIILTKNI